MNAGSSKLPNRADADIASLLQADFPPLRKSRRSGGGVQPFTPGLCVAVEPHHRVRFYTGGGLSFEYLQQDRLAAVRLNWFGRLPGASNAGCHFVPFGVCFLHLGKLRAEWGIPTPSVEVREDGL
jgi:hypothetical protein